MLDLAEEGDRVTARLAVSDPGWPVAAVEVLKVFTFRDDVIVRLDDLAHP